MDLSTTYLGMKLPHPMMAGASPLSDELDAVRQLEDAGSAAIVLIGAGRTFIAGADIREFGK